MKCQIIISMLAALFLALSPLLHGIHLTLSSHHHRICMADSCRTKSCCHVSNETPDCRQDFFLITSSFPGHADTHDPKTCPFCIQINQLLKSQFIATSQVILFFTRCLHEEPVSFFRGIINVSYNIIQPRAPPLS